MENYVRVHPITAHSDLGRWIAAQDHIQLSIEAALADFALLLRMGRN